MASEEDNPKPSLESSDPIGELERLAVWFKNHGNEEKSHEILAQIKAIRTKYTTTKSESRQLGKNSQS